MILEQSKNKMSRYSTKIKMKSFSFIISKSKAFSFLISLLTIAISYYFSLYFVKGDQLLYTNFYNDVKSTDVFTAFIMYRGYIGASEPIYFIIIYLASNIINKNIFMALINGVFMFFVSKLLVLQRINKLFILSLVFNFYFLTLFLSLERLKFSLLFFVLFIYYFKKRKISILFLTLSLLSHAQTVLLLISGYINQLFKSIIKIFTTLKIKKSPYIAIALVIAFLFVFFLQDHIISKIGSYISKGFNFSNIVKPAFFMFATFLIYKKDFPNIFLNFLPFLLGSFIFGEERIVIFTYFFFLYLSFKRSSKINIYIIISSVYFIYKGFVFLNNILLYGDGYINF